VPSVASAVLGDFEISLIRDASYWWDGGAYFGVVPKTLWSRKLPADELNRVPLAFNCYLIRTDEHTILIETAGGDKMDSRARERMKLPPVAEPLSVDPDSVDIVINTHLHWDHCGGNTILTPAGPVPGFPKARYYAPRAEWEHAHERSVRDAVSYIDANYDPLVESGRMVLVEDGHEVVPGIRMHRAPGHNRDMMVITAESRGQTFCFLSDLVPSTAHLQPTWVMAFDLYPLETIESRTQWLSRAVEGNWLCGFGHDPEVAFARIQADPKVKFVEAGAGSFRPPLAAGS
jgi:glyoxylase-like metal-dependent hydrolase (beta-lactamase superfamily II)